MSCWPARWSGLGLELARARAGLGLGSGSSSGLGDVVLACVQLREEQVGDEQMEEDGEGQHVDHDGAHLTSIAIVSTAIVSIAAARRPRWSAPRCRPSAAVPRRRAAGCNGRCSSRVA
eukprot:scaffold45218_cov61-Phaeocystis_antarctica.AAC.11